MNLSSIRYHRGISAETLLVILIVALFCSVVARADETCSSPYLARIEGQGPF